MSDIHRPHPPPPANLADRRCRCIVLMLGQPPSSSPANSGLLADAGAVLAHRVRRWPNIVPQWLSVACLLCRPTLHRECTISSRYAYIRHCWEMRASWTGCMLNLISVLLLILIVALCVTRF